MILNLSLRKLKKWAAVVITDQNLITTADTTVDFRKFEVGDTITITGSSNAGISGTVTAFYENYCYGFWYAFH